MLIDSCVSTRGETIERISAKVTGVLGWRWWAQTFAEPESPCKSPLRLPRQPHHAAATVFLIVKASSTVPAIVLKA